MRHEVLMKILVVTNLYPPYYRGGYEIRCAQVAEALHASGYDVRVLTSVYDLSLSRLGTIQPRSEEINGIRVYRWLHQYFYGRVSCHHYSPLNCQKKGANPDHPTSKIIRMDLFT